MVRWIIHPIYKTPIEVEIIKNKFHFSRTKFYAIEKNKEFGFPINERDFFNSKEELEKKYEIHGQ